MPKFEKELLPVGKYLVSRRDGSRVPREFDESFLNTVAETTNKMIQSGLRIPAPYAHIDEAVPVTDQMATSSFDNAGYWDKLVMKGKSLWGIIDAPGDENDLSTPAGKLKNTIKEVSVCIKDAWKDGLGRDWGPCMLHGAPVVHPVVPGQTEFSLLEDAVVLSTSGMLQGTMNIGELSKALQDSVNIHLPPETAPEDLVTVLLVALRQNKLSREGNEEDHEMIEPVSIFMSLPEEQHMPMSKESAEYIVNLGLLDPNTKEPVKLSDLKVEDPAPAPSDREKKLESYSLALTRTYTEDKKAGLRGRVEKLVEEGKASKEYAEKTIYPYIDEFRLSVGDEGDFVKTPVEIIIENLEALPGKTPEKAPASLLSQSLPHGSVTHEAFPQEGNEELSAEDADSLVKEMISLM